MLHALIPVLALAPAALFTAVLWLSDHRTARAGAREPERADTAADDVRLAA